MYQEHRPSIWCHRQISFSITLFSIIPHVLSLTVSEIFISTQRTFCMNVRCLGVVHVKPKYLRNKKGTRERGFLFWCKTTSNLCHLFYRLYQLNLSRSKCLSKKCIAWVLIFPLLHYHLYSELVWWTCIRRVVIKPQKLSRHTKTMVRVESSINK